MKRTYEAKKDVVPGKAAPSLEAEYRLLRRELRNAMAEVGDWPDSNTWVCDVGRHDTRLDGVTARVRCFGEKDWPEDAAEPTSESP